MMKRFIVFVIMPAVCFVFLLSPSLQAASEKESEMVFIGRKALEDGFYDVALNIFLRFLRTFPESDRGAQVRLYVAQCYFYQGRYIDALSLLENLCERRGSEKIKDAIIYWIAEVHFKGNDYRQAASNYQRIIKEFPRSGYLADAYYSLGWCLFEQGRYKEAKDVFLEMMKRFPDRQISSDASFKVAQCLYNLKDYQGLKDYLSRNIDSYQHEGVEATYAYFYLAEAEYYLGNYDEAREKYLMALKRSNDKYIESIVRLGLAWSALKREDFKEGFLHLQQIHTDTLNKREQESVKLLEATLFSQLNRYEEAIPVYEWLISKAEPPQTIMEGYLGKADSLYNLGNFKEAIAVYREALDRLSAEELEYSSIDRLHYGLAWAYLKEGEFKEAINEFQKVVQKSDDKIIKVAALCQVADTYLDSAQYQKAIEAYDKVLKDYAEGIYCDYAQYQLGVSLLRMSKYDAAELAFLNLLRKFPDSKLVPEATYSLGITYFQKGDYVNSSEEFSRFVAQFNNNRLRPQAMYMKATSLYNLGRFDEAMNTFKEIVRQYNEEVSMVQKAEYEIADCLYQMGKEKEAVNKFLILRSKYPASSLAPEVVWWLGEYYYRQQKFNIARRYFKSLINDYPSSSLVADSYYAIACSYGEENNFEEAIVNFKKVSEFDNHELQAEAFLAIAEIYLKTDRLNEALVICEGTLAKHSNLSAVILPIMAQIYKKKGELQEAISLFRKALDEVPLKQGANLQFELASCLEEQGDISAAIEEYLKIGYLYSHKEPTVVKALLRAAQIFEAREEYIQAKNIYEKIINLEVPESKFAREKIEQIAERQKVALK